MNVMYIVNYDSILVVEWEYGSYITIWFLGLETFTICHFYGMIYSLLLCYMYDKDTGVFKRYIIQRGV